MFWKRSRGVIEGSSLPNVPGPRLSARTLTSEKAPDMVPNPSPTTYAKMWRLLNIWVDSLSVNFFSQASALLFFKGTKMLDYKTTIYTCNQDRLKYKLTGALGIWGIWMLLEIVQRTLIRMPIDPCKQTKICKTHMWTLINYNWWCWFSEL